MKKSFLSISLWLIGTVVFAQSWTKNLNQSNRSVKPSFFEYQNAFKDYWKNYEVKNGYYFENGQKKKAIGWKQFKRWEYQMENKINPSTGEFPNQTAYQIYREYLNGKSFSRAANASNWTSLGPNSSGGGYAGIGRVNCIAFHPQDNNTYWVGVNSGGLWVTTNNGQSWSCLTDNNEVLAVSDIIIPSDYATSKTIYIATGDKDAWDNNSVGVLKSTDGGLTWNKTGLSFGIGDYKMVYKLLIHPSNNQTLVAATNVGVYKTTNGGTNWSVINSNNFIDLEYKPGDFNTLYGSTNAGKVMVSTNGGTNFTEKFNNDQVTRIELAVSPNQPSWLYFVGGNSDNGLYGVYVSKDNGQTFNMVLDGNTTNILGYEYDGSDEKGQAWYDLTIEASPNNAQSLFVGGINTWRSTDGGAKWQIVNHWYGQNGVFNVHADKHQLKFRNNGELFECNDGGVYISSDNGDNWTDKTNGMVISQIYKLGVSQTESKMTITGLQDNGTKLNYANEWYDVKGGDGMECLIDYTDYKIQYATYVEGQIDRTTDYWTNRKEIQPADAGQGAWVTPYIIDPNNNNILYAGYADIWKTTNKGDNWVKISSMASADKIRSMAIAPSNTQVLYVADKSKIWKTTNGGGNWTEITGSLPVNTGSITSITVKHDDDKKIWVSLGGYNTNRIFESADGGTNWTNVSAGLPSIPVYSIVQNKTILNEVHLYAGTEVGVFFKQGSNNWIPFNTNLPNVQISELEFLYSANANDIRLRGASYGRGLWETPISSSSVVELYPYSEKFETAVPPLGWLASDFLLSNASQAGKAPGANGNFAYYDASNKAPGSIGTLITPVFEPEANSKTLRFKLNYYIMNSAWKDAGAKLFVDFSEDQGQSWKLDTLNNILASLSNYNSATTGWIEKSVDLSAYIGKKVNVRFRAVSDYGMANIGIDDIAGPKISLLNNDIAAKRLAVSMNGYGFCQFTPASQLDSIYFQVQVTNNGALKQNNINLKANINNDVDFNSGYKNPLSSLESGKSDTIWVSAKPKISNDTSTVNYGTKIWVEQNEKDEMPENNLADSAAFSSTKNVFLRTLNYSGNYTSYIFGNSAPAKSGFEFGAKYLILKETRIDSIFAYLPKAGGAGNVVAKLYTITRDSANKLVYTLVANSANYQPAAGANNDFTNFPLVNPYTCKANTELAVMVQFNGDFGNTNKDTIHIGVDAKFPSSPNQASLAYLNVNGNMGWYTINVVPIIGIFTGSNCQYNLSQDNFACASIAANYDNVSTVITSNDCSWNASVIEGSEWLSTVSSGKGNGSIKLSVTENKDTLSRVGQIKINDKILTITQNRACSYQLSASSFNCPDNKAANYEKVASIFTDSSCSWNTISNNDWITVSQGGKGNGNISVTVTENSSKNQRIGSITVNDKNIIIIQPGMPEIPCAYNLSISTFNCSDNNDSEYIDFVDVTTDSTCEWNAVSNNDWITTSSVGKGNGKISIAVSENTSKSQRIGSVSIKDETVIIIQPGTPETVCSYSLSVSNFICTDFTSAEFNDISSVNTDSNCTWTAKSNNDWITTNSTGKGNGSISISVTENTSSSQRTGSVTVNDVTLVIVQPGSENNPCIFMPSTLSFTCEDNQETDSLFIANIETDSNCAWSAMVIFGNDWLSTNSAANGTGEILVKVLENNTDSQRVGHISVEGNTIQVIQPGKIVNCQYSLSNTSFTCDNNLANPYNDIADINTDSACAWTAVSNDSWISTSSAGKGNGSISINVSENTDKKLRTGSLNINGNTLVIIQPGVPEVVCNYSVSETKFDCANNEAAEYLNIANVNTDSSCLWTAVSNDTWITTNSAGKGNGSININVLENLSTSQRVGSISVQDKTILIFQPGKIVVPCNYNLSDTVFNCNNFSAQSYADIAQVFTDTACSWSASTEDAWITTSSAGKGNGSISIAVSENTTSNPRIGFVKVADKSIKITQPAKQIIPCVYTLSISNYSCADNKAKEYQNIALVTTDSSCSWTAVSNDSWISTSSGAKGSGNISITVTENTGSTPRTGSIKVDDKTIVITQPAAVVCNYNLSNSNFNCPNNKANNYQKISSVTAPNGCAWSATIISGNNWLSTTSTGNGNGDINISVTENTSDSIRAGIISVEGKLITIVQPAAVNCTYSLSSNSFTCPNNKANSYQKISAVTAPNGCAWSAKVISGNDWITSSSVGSGNGDVSIMVTENTTGTIRAGIVSVEGKLITIAQPALTTGINENENKQVLVYPNPANQFLNILFNQNTNGVIAIYNMNGKLVLSRPLNNQANNIDISELNKGIYFYEITNDDKLNIRGKFSVVK